MPISTNLNVSPIFDDFNANNQYYRILFRPATAVQGRELTQVQSILQDQIEKFGNWAFKNGDIVSGCGISDISALPYVRLQDFQTNSASYDITSFVNTQVTSAVSNLSARVIHSVIGSNSAYPNTNVLYINYLNTGINGEKVFSNNEVLNFSNIPTTGANIAQINSFSNSASNTNTVGDGHGIVVSDGVVFINGTFVQVLFPTFGIVNPFDTYAANNVVGFQCTETKVSENEDPSLLDNALGYSNENAPGAWRLKIEPYLVSLDPATAANTPGFNPIIAYNYGSVVQTSKAGSNVYSIIGDAIAQRIYDEAGNYVINPFAFDATTNVTGNSIISSIDSNHYLGPCCRSLRP